MSLPVDARPGVPGASPQPDQAEQPQTFEQIHADLESYFWMQLHPPTHESVDYLLGDGAELSMLFDIADIDGIDKLLEGTDIQVPIGKFHVPDSGFIRLSDTPQGRTIRFGITFSGEPEAQPSENFGIELNLAETDGTVGIYESHTSLDGTPQGKEERLKTEKVLLNPDQMRSIAGIIDKYSPSGSITHQATRRARVDGGMPPDIRQHAEQLRHLAGQDLGVLGAGWGVLPEGGNGLVMMVEEGMPDELKDILATALPGVKISFQEATAPELYSQTAGEAATGTPSDRRTSPRSISEIRAVNREARTTGHELIVPEEAKERNLQNAFVEVLASAGIPFETAFEIADVAWDVHQLQTQRRAMPDEPTAPREPSPEEIAERERLASLTEAERETESRAVWDRLEAQPGFRRSMKRSIREMERGEYFSGDILDFGNRIPKLKVVKKSEAAKKWGELEKRIPGLRGKLTQAWRDSDEGKGSVLLDDGTLVPVQEYMAQQAVSNASEQVLIDNTTTDLASVQE